MRWTADRRVLLLLTYFRYVKKQIAHKDIRTEFIKAVGLNGGQVPKHDTLMNYVSHCKQMVKEAADIREDIDRLSRTPTEVEKYKELLSSKQQDLQRVLSEFGAQGNPELEHEMYRLGNEVKLDQSMAQSKQALDAETASLKQKGDNLATQILENREYSESPQDEEPRVRHKMAYCHPDDPAWAERRSRRDFMFGGGELADSFLATKDNIVRALQAKDTALNERFDALDDRIEDRFTELKSRLDRKLTKLEGLLADLLQTTQRADNKQQAEDEAEDK